MAQETFIKLFKYYEKEIDAESKILYEFWKNLKEKEPSVQDTTFSVMYSSAIALSILRAVAAYLDDSNKAEPKV